MPPAEQSSLWHTLERSDSAGWMHFVPDAGPTVEEFWSRYAPESFMGDEDDNQLIREETDELGITHRRYQQVYQGFPVRGAEITLHSQGDRVNLAHGKWLQQREVSDRINIEEEEALERALIAVGADLYAWEDSAYLTRWQELQEDPDLSLYPKGELLIHRKFEEINEGQVEEIHRLTWYMEISAIAPSGSWGVYVDAENGHIFDQTDLLHKCTVTGTCNTLYNGAQNFTIRQRGWPYNDFTLKDCDRKLEVGANNITHNSLNWGNTHQGETSSLWAAQQIWDYLMRIAS